MKTVYIGLGLLFLGLGVVGVMVPLLPTVPFLLLASFCFSRGSRRFYTWFVSTAMYRNHLKEFEQSWSMPIKSKIGVLTFSTLMMSLPLFIVDNRLVHFLILLLLAVKYYIFLIKIKTIR